MPPLAAAAAIFSIGSSLFSMFGASRAGARQQRAFDRMAADELERGEEDVRFYQRKIGLLLGQQRVGGAAQGLDVTQGSLADITRDTRITEALDTATIRRNAQRAARGIRAQGQAAGSAARLNATQFGLQAAGTLLGLAADPWDRYVGRQRAVSSVATGGGLQEWL